MTNTEWMIYGANGYTAKLAIEKAVAQGRRPVLAGRNKAVIAALSDDYDLPYRIFDLANIDEVARNLADIKVVSHCAGPFSATADSMMRGCIKSGTHYTDITGEMDVFLLSQTLHEQAQAAGVVLCPGVGFDVIPTDCVASKLKQALPDATHLCLGFDGAMSMSPGTAKTMVEMIPSGTKALRNGELVEVPRDFESRDINFGKKLRHARPVSWGDLATAPWHTGIQNMVVYIPAMGGKKMDFIFPIAKQLLKLKTIQRYAVKRIEQKVEGPSKEDLASQTVYIWGEATNANGDTVTCRVTTSAGYTVTMDGILMSSEFLMNYEGNGGCQTPSQLMGTDLVERLPGASQLVLS